METPTYWRKCSVCKRPISFNKIYQVCTVSSCRKSVYCSVECFDTHVPLMNHKSAWAEERRAPSLDLFLKEQQHPEEAGEAPRRFIVDNKIRSEVSHSDEILIVASKLKTYIKERSEMNTSSSVMDRLSDIVRILCNRAIEEARNEGRKTVMDRDFDFFNEYK